MEDDINLINQVKSKKDNDSLRELINRHSGIYVDMVNKYMPESIEGNHRQDILDEKNYSIYDAVIKFDESKNAKLSTYVGNIAKWKCLNIYNKNKKFPHNSLFNDDKPSDRIDHENFIVQPDISKIENTENLNKIYKFVSKAKDPRVKKIFKMRYSKGNKTTPWKKIAKKLDLSIQGCINIHNNYLKEIKKYVQ